MLDVTVTMALIKIIAIAGLFLAMILFAIRYNVNKTKKNVLLEMFRKIFGDSSVAENYSVLGFFAEKANKEELLSNFKDMFRLMSLQELKKLKIEKLDVDIYNIHQDIDDLRREAIEKKVKREKQSW
jgi:hypothetical protein